MIKKIIVGLFAFFIILPVRANVLLQPTAVQTVVDKYVSADKQAAVISAIVAKTAANNNTGINASDLVDVCQTAAGWNLSNENDLNKCYGFAQDILNASTVDYRHVCLQDSVPEGATKQCYDDFKNIKVDRRSAVFLAKDLVYHKNSDEAVFCAKEESNWKESFFDDYIPCTSKMKNSFYEVHFDSATESNDVTRRRGIVEAVCRVFNNVEYRAGGCISANVGVPTNATCWSTYCNTSDVNTCNKISKDLSAYGFGATLKDEKCEILFNAITNASNLKNQFRDNGVDSFAFCRGIQITSNASLDDQIAAYVHSKGVKVTSFSCKKSDVVYTGGGCTTKIGNSNDDVLRCTINGQDVDFVFDDLSETWETISRGGYQGMACIASDGSYDGNTCMGVNQQACELVKKQSKSVCPECEKVYWDATNNLCVLPASANATNLQKGIQVGTTVVTVALATVVTVYSGGTAAPGAWAVVATVGSGLTVAGGTMVIASEVATKYQIYTAEFQSQLNACLTGTDIECAKKLLSKNLQQMVSYEKDLTDAEKKTLDESFAKLFKKIPAEDDFWNWLDNPDVWQCNSRGDCVVKEKAQFWQVIRTSGDVAMILGGVLKSLALIGSSMTKTTEVMQEIAQTRKARIVNNPLKNIKSNLVKDVTYGNKNSLSIPNSVLKQGVTIDGKTLRFNRNSELARYLINNGYKVGDTVEIELQAIKQSVMVPTTTVSFANVVFYPAALASSVYGTGDLLVDGETIPFVMRRPSAPEEPDVKPGPRGDDKRDVVPAPIVVPEPGPVDSSDGAQLVYQTMETPAIVQEPAATQESVTQQNQVVPSGAVGNSAVSNNTNVKKGGISGLGVAAIGAGIAGLGVGAALLLSNDKDDTNVAADVQNANLDLFYGAKARANGIIGNVDDSPIELVSIETIAGTKEKIVSINRHAVVVVKHNNNLIPFVADMKDGTMQWVPFVNVDVNTDAFDKYSSDKDIMKTAKIAGKLSEVLPPLRMHYFASPNATGLQFLAPNSNGYQTINNNTLRYLHISLYKNRRCGGFFNTLYFIKII